MRIDGFSSQSYPLKRKPRKANVTVDESVEDSPDFVEVQSEAPSGATVSTRSQGSAGARIGAVPARQQDMIFPRSMSKSVANALASYLTTAGFVEWDMEVLGLDIHI